MIFVTSFFGGGVGTPVYPCPALVSKKQILREGGY